jgi:hypothetical protein
MSEQTQGIEQKTAEKWTGCVCCGSIYDDTGILYDPENVSGICGQCLSEI